MACTCVRICVQSYIDILPSDTGIFARQINADWKCARSDTVTMKHCAVYCLKAVSVIL